MVTSFAVSSVRVPVFAVRSSTGFDQTRASSSASSCFFRGLDYAVLVRRENTEGAHEGYHTRVYV